MCPAPYGSRLNWDVICAGKTDSSLSSSCQLCEMNIRLSIYACALTVNVLQLNTRPHSGAIHSLVSRGKETERNNWNVSAVPTLSLSWLAFSSYTHPPPSPFACPRDLQKCRLGSPRYQFGDARGRLNSVRQSKPLQISPLILLLAQWFNTAQPFCSSRTKSFCWNHPACFLWLNTSRQRSVDWQDCGFLPSASICYSHLPQSLTHELSLGSVQIACLERYKNQIIVSSTVKCSRISCQPKPAGDASRQYASSHTVCNLQRLSADMLLYLNICLFMSLFYHCPDCLRFGKATKGVNRSVCLVNENTQWP